LVANKKDLVETRDYTETFKDIIMDTEGNESKVVDGNAKKKPDFRLESL